MLAVMNRKLLVKSKRMVVRCGVIGIRAKMLEVRRRKLGGRVCLSVYEPGRVCFSVYEPRLCIGGDAIPKEQSNVPHRLAPVLGRLEADGRVAEREVQELGRGVGVRKMAADLE